jgi:hypothetical protein
MDLQWFKDNNLEEEYSDLNTAYQKNSILVRAFFSGGGR